MDKRRDLTQQGEPYKRGQAKMYMFSGYDSTSSILLGTLNAFDPQFPSFASTVILKLHELPVPSSSSSEEEKADLYLKSVPPYELTLPTCGYPCRLDKLKELYEDVMVDGEKWKEACGSKE